MLTFLILALILAVVVFVVVSLSSSRRENQSASTRPHLEIITEYSETSTRKADEPLAVGLIIDAQVDYESKTSGRFVRSIRIFGLAKDRGRLGIIGLDLSVEEWRFYLISRAVSLTISETGESVETMGVESSKTPKFFDDALWFAKYSPDRDVRNFDYTNFQFSETVRNACATAALGDVRITAHSQWVTVHLIEPKRRFCKVSFDRRLGSLVCETYGDKYTVSTSITDLSEALKQVKRVYGN